MFENNYRKPTRNSFLKQIYFPGRLTDNILLLEARGKVSAIRYSVLQ